MPTSQEKISASDALGNLRKRLLDLTARNRLINFRHTKGTSLRVIDELANQLVETLLSEVEMRFLPVPEPTRKQLIDAGYMIIDDETGQEIRLRKDPKAEEWALQLGFQTSYEVPESSQDEGQSNHADKDIQTLLFPYELETRLRNLRQKAETAIEETGANILFVAFGFLEWFDSNHSEKPRYAPLFLVPANLKKGRLNKNSGTYEYTLKYSGEDIIPNLSLREKLKVDFGLALPDLDENTQPELYFELVKKLISENQPQWRLRRHISIALLNFSKLLMYLDLDPDRWPDGNKITDHPVVERFLTGYEAANEESGSAYCLGCEEEYSIDDLPDIHDKYPLIDDADSSQHSALIDAIDGKNLVIEGPPGTGKSQTITNLIAAAIAQKKTILFVAEKLAALEVVKRRLDAAGLGEFCLELHSHKSQKRKIIDDISARINKHGRYREPTQIDADIARYEELKLALKTHAESINRKWKRTGKTVHEILMAATRYRERIELNPEAVHPNGYNSDNFDGNAQRQTRDMVLLYRDVYQAMVGRLDDARTLEIHPWYGVHNVELQIFDTDRVVSSLEEWQSSLEEFTSIFPILSDTLVDWESAVTDSLKSLSELLDSFERLPKLVGNEVLSSLRALRGDALEKTINSLNQFKIIQSLYNKLSSKVSTEVLEDFSAVDKYLNASAELRKLFGDSVDIGAILKSAKHLSVLQKKLLKIKGPISAIRSHIGEQAGKHLDLSESGLREFIVFIETVSALQPMHWKLRSDIFENDELDQLLPKIRSELESLHVLKKEIDFVYNDEILPDYKKLIEIKSTLAGGGIFRWFKKDWRSSRKKLLSLAANQQVKFSTLVSLIDKAVTFSHDIRKFENNPSYLELLGVHAKGLKTDLATLETLRAWYRRIRNTYGAAFGSKIALGDAIIGLHVNFARAIRSLSQQGVGKYLNSILEEFEVLKSVFKSVKEVQKGNVPLIGEYGVIKKLLKVLERGLNDCKPIIVDKEITIAQILNLISGLDKLRNLVAQWEETDIDKLYFGGTLGLRIGMHEGNQAALDRAHNTTEVAKIIEREISPCISECIYLKPEKATFELLSRIGKQLKAAVVAENEKRTSFISLVGLDWNVWVTNCRDNIKELIKRNLLALTNKDTLQNWIDYVRVRDRLLSIGFEKLILCVEQRDLSESQLEVAYFAGIYDLIAREILQANPELSYFSGHSQEALQKQFTDYDERLKSLQCERIAWKLDQAKIPVGITGARVSEYTELSLLKHECGKKTRHLPIRQILKRSSHALLSMKPCFMMGPMSVARYLEPGLIEFDMVIMDEASQIKPEDALGAITRGKQLVVVGDPKQLPPTSFFDKIIADEDDDTTAIEESESILDATIPMYPARRLRWHYRSQHESLIAFSNNAFYDGDLVLFPSPIKESSEFGVRYSRVNRGCFVNRRNLEEAKYLANGVREHFREIPEETLGVVAMSAEQRDQIERSVELLAKEDFVFQQALEKDQQRQESLFIKNLENVQGDERDVILVGMTYGPHEIGGRVFQRFGPINSDVGWRRLNVLFTRSRKRMCVFSSMGSDDVAIGPNSKRGVKALRDFLAYAETGILHSTEGPTGRNPDSDFEIAVADALRNEGFNCVPQVGVAGFFIDIAVVDPGNNARYLMGIECDGATYHSAKSVRDRDRLRQTILERLGWKIRRIWSTDWFKNPKSVLQPIIRELNEIKSEITEDLNIESELSEIAIESAAEKVKEPLASFDQFVPEETSLEEKLMQYDKEIIRKELPGTPENKRLLRPAMLEAFLEYLPTNKSEFLEFIPGYLRESTKSDEGKFLERVLEIINLDFEEVPI